MTVDEFNVLMKMPKAFLDLPVCPPVTGTNTILEVTSLTTSDQFNVDIDRRSSFTLSKCKLQNRTVIKNIPLVRIDIDSPPHMNPDGSKTSRNHIHIYNTADGDTGKLSWAYSLESFDGISYQPGSKFMDIFLEFCRYCNIKATEIQGVL